VSISAVSQKKDRTFGQEATRAQAKTARSLARAVRENPFRTITDTSFDHMTDEDKIDQLFDRVNWTSEDLRKLNHLSKRFQLKVAIILFMMSRRPTDD